MGIPVDERPAVAATRLGRDEEHRRWLTTVATAVDAPPGTVGPTNIRTVIGLLTLLLLLLLVG